MLLKDEVLVLIDDEINAEDMLGNEHYVTRLRRLRAEIEKLFDENELKAATKAKNPGTMLHPGKDCVMAHRGLSHDEWENRASHLMSGFKEGRGEDE